MLIEFPMLKERTIKIFLVIPFEQIDNWTNCVHLAAGLKIANLHTIL